MVSDQTLPSGGWKYCTPFLEKLLIDMGRVLSKDQDDLSTDNTMDIETDYTVDLIQWLSV